MARGHLGSSDVLYRSVVPVSAFPVSISLWNYTVGTGNGFTCCIGDGATAQNRVGITARTTGPTIAAFATVAGSNLQLIHPGTMSTSVWNHFGASWSGSGREVWLNGAQHTGTAIGDPMASTIETVIGARDSTAGVDQDGYAAEFAVWSATLSVGEWGALSRGVSPSQVRPDALAFYAPLVRGESELVLGVPLTVGGTPTIEPHPRVYDPSPVYVPQFTAAAPPPSATVRLRPAFARIP